MANYIAEKPPKVPFYNDPFYRGILFQLALFIVVAFLGYQMYDNARINIAKQNLVTGFNFLQNTAGFQIPQALIPYHEGMSYGRAFVVSILNTLLVAVIGVFFATILGFFVGVARLSKNYVVAKMAYWYVEFIRNLPLLFQLIFWYLVLINVLPAPRDSYAISDLVFFNQRGLYVPDFFDSGLFKFVLMALVTGLLAAFFWNRNVTKKQETTGQQLPRLIPTLGLIVVFPLLVYFALGQPLTIEKPALSGFNIRGGISVIPELVALLIGLVTYTAGFIAEIVRSGIQAVNYGQTEAGRSLGLQEGKILNLVVIPQALRVIIPPLTSQFLNLTKNSSLAVGIGYPDMVSVGQTILNQSGQAIEIVAMWMAVYLTISISISLFMNWYNAKIALVER